MPLDARRLRATALLRHVGQFVRQQTPARNGRWRILPGSEYDVVPDGVGACPQRARRRGGGTRYPRVVTEPPSSFGATLALVVALALLAAAAYVGLALGETGGATILALISAGAFSGWVKARKSSP